MRPVIGITAYAEEDVRWGVWTLPATLVPLAYIQIIDRAGGRPLVDHASIKSHHHQAFGRLGTGLREAARADDGTIEAVEHESRRFAVGVLWHPEVDEDARLFERLVEEALEYRKDRRR